MDSLITQQESAFKRKITQCKKSIEKSTRSSTSYKKSLSMTTSNAPFVTSHKNITDHNSTDERHTQAIEFVAQIIDELSAIEVSDIPSTFPSNTVQPADIVQKYIFVPTGRYGEKKMQTHFFRKE